MDISLLLVLFFAVFVPIVSVMGLVFYLIRSYSRVGTETQAIISDRDILLLISKQPDGLLSGEQLAEMSGLSKSEAKTRLYQLHAFGVLKIHHTAWLKGYYSLSDSIDTRPAPTFSEAPFLTVEDLLQLFKHFDYRLTPQQLIMATGMPLNIIKREIKYFKSEGILETLTQTDSNGMMLSKTFVLREPYRSHPERFLERQLDLNRQMETILRREDLV